MDNKLINYSLEYIMGDRFGKFSKYVIQDRALPDVRDGLKPVQRRILYSMYIDGNLPSKAYRKSAKTVGYVMGNYHPHGDSSIYDAMVRMSQSWKQRVTLIDMHGNNGSIDEDPAAAMRYTESRLTSISMELLKDLDKNTVEMALNFDDTLEEPTVLPAKFPNILVNGAKGIAVGIATNIPPHNLNEVIDATIYRINHPECNLEDLFAIVHGPDFPTGAIIRGKEGIKDAFATGSGTFQIVSKIEKVEQKKFTQLIITEIPYEVVKSTLVSRIDKIRNDKEIDGILEVRDESDRNGLRVVVEINKEADYDAIVNYLMKKTDLSVKYSYNTVAICDKKPRQLGLIDILDYYIAHQKDVILRRTAFELEKSRARLHIVEGLIIAIANIDEVIHIIRASSGKEDSKNRLIERFSFSMKQAEAIVVLQLYRLNSTDIHELENEKKDLFNYINDLEEIQNSEKKLCRVIIDELKTLNRQYPTPRLSIIEDDIIDFTVEKRPVLNEMVYIAVTRDGYFKRSSIKSYSASEGTLPGCKNGDIVLGVSQAATVDILLAFTNRGNYLFIPVFELVDTKWKEEGKHISNLASLGGEEKIVSVILVKDFKEGISVALCSKAGKIKRTNLKEFIMQRYSKPVTCMLLEGPEDELISASICDGDSTIIVASLHGYALQYHESTVSLIGIRTQGVKAMNLEDNDCIASCISINKNQKDSVLLVTEQGGYRIFNPTMLSVNARSANPSEIYKFYRSDPHLVKQMVLMYEQARFAILSSVRGAVEIEFDGMRATPLGKSIKVTLTSGNETILSLSNYSIPQVNNETKVYKPVEKPQQNKIKVEDDIDQITLFDYIEKL